jgi:hypothetical protein
MYNIGFFNKYNEFQEIIRNKYFKIKLCIFYKQ